jgi:nucleotide-binding universal stress UspA family protein
MRAFREILVAHDGSKRSDRALSRALQLAGPDARVEILHIVEPSADLKRAQRLMQARLALIPSWSSNPRGRLTTTAGAVPEMIAADVRRREPDLLILGMHRKRGLRDYLGATTAARIMAEVAIPTLLAVAGPPRPFERILVGLDYEESAGTALRYVVGQFPDVAIDVVHVLEDGYRRPPPGPETILDLDDARRAWLEKTAARLLDANATTLRLRIAGLVLAHGNPAQALVAEVKNPGGDLLALGTHARPGLMRALLGSVTQSLILDPPCDLLIVPASRSTS